MGRGGRRLKASAPPASDGEQDLVGPAVEEALLPVARWEEEQEIHKLQKRIRSYFVKAAKGLEWDAKPWMELVEEYAEKVYSSVFQGLNDRPWIMHADFLMVLDAGVKETFPPEVLQGIPGHLFEKAVLNANDRAFEEQRYSPMLWETIGQVVQGPKIKKKAYDAWEAGRKDAAGAAGVPGNPMENFLQAWVGGTIGRLAADSGGMPDCIVTPDEAVELFHRLIDAGALPIPLTSAHGAPPRGWRAVDEAVYGAYEQAGSQWTGKRKRRNKAGSRGVGKEDGGDGGLGKTGGSDGAGAQGACGKSAFGEGCGKGAFGDGTGRGALGGGCGKGACSNGVGGMGAGAKGACGKGASGKGACGQGAGGMGGGEKGACGTGAFGKGACGKGACEKGAGGTGAFGMGACGKGAYGKGACGKGACGKGACGMGGGGNGAKRPAQGSWNGGEDAKRHRGGGKGKGGGGNPVCTQAEDCVGSPASGLVQHMDNGQFGDVYCSDCWNVFSSADPSLTAVPHVS